MSNSNSDTAVEITVINLFPEFVTRKQLVIHDLNINYLIKKLNFL